MNKVTFHFPQASLDDLPEMRRLIEETAVTFTSHQEAISELLLAVNEAITNILIHGYQSQPGPIDIEISGKGTAVIITLRDQAPLFDPTSALPPNTILPLEHRQPGGLGIHMMRQFTNQLQHQPLSHGGNELKLVKA